MNELLCQFTKGTYHPVLIEFPSLFLCNQSALDSLRDAATEVIRAIEEAKDSPIIKVGRIIKSLPSLAGLLLSYVAIYHTEDDRAKLTDAEVKVVSVRTDVSI